MCIHACNIDVLKPKVYYSLIFFSKKKVSTLYQHRVSLVGIEEVLFLSSLSAKAFSAPRWKPFFPDLQYVSLQVFLYGWRLRLLIPTFRTVNREEIREWHVKFVQVILAQSAFNYSFLLKGERGGWGDSFLATISTHCVVSIAFPLQKRNEGVSEYPMLLEVSSHKFMINKGITFFWRAPPPLSLAKHYD